MTAAVGGPATPAATPATAAERPKRIPPRVRRELRAFAELFALAGFAVAQPLFDVFGRAPDQFIFRGATSGDIVGFALVVLLLPALVLWAIEALVSLVSEPARKGLHLGFVALLVAAFAVQVGRSWATGLVLWAAAALVGALAAVLYHRTTAARLWLGFAAFAPPAFAALFLLASQTAPLLREPGAADGVRIGEPGPVVVVVFDELPLAALLDADGTIDAELYPNFAELADGSHWFRNTTAISNFTWSAVPSLLTSTLPRDGTTPTAASHPRSLFTLLGGSMDLQVNETVTRVCPTDLCSVDQPNEGGLGGILGDARDVMEHRLALDPADTDPVAGLVADDAAAEPDDEGGAQATDARVASFLDGLDDGSDTLHYLHVLLPHVPYRYLADGTRYATPDPDLGRTGDTWQDQPWLVELARQRLSLQLGHADDVLGQAVQRMRDQGFYDDATVVVVADHGVSFQAGRGIRGLDLDQPMTDPVAAEIMWVPFFVKTPGQTEGEVSDANVSTLDVLPTIADVLDIDVPWELDGRSAFGPPRETGVKEMYLAAYEGTEILAGEPYRIETEVGWPLVLDRSIDRLLPAGPGGAEARHFRVGPRTDLIGTRVDDARDGLLRPTPIALLPDSDPSNVRPDSGQVPALVMGLLAEADAGQAVAVAVNGRIAAVVPAYVDGDDTRLAAVVPSGVFREGANDVEAYLVG